MDKKSQILVIEDELHLRELYVRVLSEAGFDVSSAIDGQQGLVLAQNKPDLILLDIMMPKLNGLEVLKNLKGEEKTKDISIVLLTNLGQEAIIRKALLDGARGYLMKVRLSPYDLVNKVREFLENPQLKTDIDHLDID